MIISAGQTVLVTGASGGIGTYITTALAERKVKLALVAFPGEGLEALRAAVKKQGVEAEMWVADLRIPEQRYEMLKGVRRAFGEVDILVNNAGVEFTSAFHELSEEKLRDILNVNLTVPMELTRLVLPEMLRNRRGHIVNISSLAGKSGPAFQEPYAATKAALVAFTSSLRASYRGTGVSASVVTPGFVEAGIYTSLKSRSGHSAPRLLGTSQPAAVARAVLAVIENDALERIVNPMPIRPLLALSAMFPSFGEWVAEQTGTNQFFRKVVEELSAQSRRPTQ